MKQLKKQKQTSTKGYQGETSIGGGSIIWKITVSFETGAGEPRPLFPRPLALTEIPLPLGEREKFVLLGLGGVPLTAGWGGIGGNPETAGLGGTFFSVFRCGIGGAWGDWQLLLFSILGTGTLAFLWLPGDSRTENSGRFSLYGMNDGVVLCLGGRGFGGGLFGLSGEGEAIDTCIYFWLVFIFIFFV